MPFVVFINLIRRNDNNRFDRIDPADCFENIYCADDIRRISRNRLAIRFSDQALRGEMQDDLRLKVFERRLESRQITNIAESRIDCAVEFEIFKKIRRILRRERISANFAAEHPEPKSEPAAFETRVPGD